MAYQRDACPAFFELHCKNNGLLNVAFVSGARQDRQSRGWSEEEERLYLEGLKLHGRYAGLLSLSAVPHSVAQAGHVQSALANLTASCQQATAKSAR